MASKIVARGIFTPTPIGTTKVKTKCERRAAKDDKRRRQRTMLGE